MISVALTIIIVLFIYFITNKSTEHFITNMTIYCINLDKSKDRMRKINKNFKNLNLSVTRFEAIDGNNVIVDTNKVKLDYDTNLNSLCDKNIKPGINLKLSKGEIGCIYSHYGLWEKMLDKNIEKCIIVEDDIKPNKNFNTYKKYLSKVPNDWDIIYISFLNTGKKKYVSKNIYIPTCGFSTSGYIINLKCVKKIMKKLPINRPIDLFLLELFKNKIINAYVIEGLCDASSTWGGNDSQIEHSTKNIKKYKI